MYWKRLEEDIRTISGKDPAARTVFEILFCYPGLHAVWLYRIAHWLWSHKIFFPARFISHMARFITGIEIHPGAKIGRRFFIDHGMGVVIGETAVIGDDVLMYQGAVLGGTSLLKEKRHPTLGDRVVVGTGAVVLGPVRVGDDARIGSGSVVVKSVPAGTTVVGVPARPVSDRTKTLSQLEHARLDDPVGEALKVIMEEQEKLEQRIICLEQELESKRHAFSGEAV